MTVYDLNKGHTSAFDCLNAILDTTGTCRSLGYLSRLEEWAVNLYIVVNILS